MASQLKEQLKRVFGLGVMAVCGDALVEARNPPSAKVPISAGELDRKARQLRRQVMAFHAWPPDMPAPSLEPYKSKLLERYEVR